MNNMFEVVLRHLDARKGDWDIVAKESGVNRSTVYRIGRRETKNPTIQNVEKLYKYFTKAA